VIVEGDDLYGDEVKIAARIEALADAGGVFISAFAKAGVPPSWSRTARCDRCAG
jgi:class 3 adenylate cyclase